ncbi:MAG: VTT domain-containing protein [Thiobacillus sp.]|nr:VTT domain-containing protein [Thiobacillus sp.]
MNKTVLRWLLGLILVLAVGTAIALRDRFDAVALQAWVEGAGAAGPLLFIGVYALVTVLFLPGSVITLAGGVLFGPVWGTVYNLTGATIGAALAFLIARYLAAGWVTQRTGGRMKQLVDGVEQEGWRFVAFVRLVPLFPFNLLNYALGLTRIRFWHYVLASYIFMLPGATAYTWLGYAGREALAGGEGMIRNILIALALLASVAFLPRLIKRLRAQPMLAVDELKRRLNAGEKLLLLDVRSAADFAGEKGHIAGALNIPLEELAARQGELESRREQPVLLICTTDRRSSRAVAQLTVAGFAKVQVVQGGMNAWHEHGWPVVNE